MFSEKDIEIRSKQNLYTDYQVFELFHRNLILPFDKRSRQRSLLSAN